MRKKLKRLVALSLSLAVVGTSINLPTVDVKANTLDKGTPFNEYTVVGSSDKDVKFVKNRDNSEKAKHPDYWGILDGDTSLTKLGTLNEEEAEYSGEAGSGIVTWQNNDNVKSSDMGDFKFKFNYLLKGGKGGSDLNVYDSDYSGDGDTYSDGDICGFEFKPLYASGKIRVWGVSPYQNYTTGEVVVSASEKDLEKMTLEYYGENKSEPTIIDLGTNSVDGMYKLNTNETGWYYLTYEDEGYLSDGMGDEVTGGSDNYKGQIFGFSFYTGKTGNSNIAKVKDHVSVTKSANGNLQNISINTSDKNLTKVTPLSYIIKNNGTVKEDTGSSISLSDSKVVVTTVREYYQINSNKLYQTLTRVKTYYSESGDSKFNFESGMYKYSRPDVSVASYKNYLPYIMKDYFASNFVKSQSITFNKGLYNGNYKMKYQIPDASEIGGKRTITENITVDYGAPFIKVFGDDNTWKTMENGGTYSIKNGASVKAKDTFSNIKSINRSAIKYKFTKGGKDEVEVNGTNLVVTQDTNTGDISFKAERNTGKFLDKKDNSISLAKSGYTNAGDAENKKSSFEYDVYDNNTLTLSKEKKQDAITCTVSGATNKTITFPEDLTLGQGSSDTKDITDLFTKAGTYNIKMTYTSNTLKELGDDTEYTVESNTNYYTYATVTIVDNKLYDADSVTVTIPTLTDDSLAKNSLSGFSCTFNFVDGAASTPSGDPTGDNDGQITAPTPKPETTENPQTTQSPSATQKPTSKPTETPANGTTNLQKYWGSDKETEINEPLTLTWNKNLLEQYKSDFAEGSVALYVLKQDDENNEWNDLTNESSIEINKFGTWKFNYFDGLENNYFCIKYVNNNGTVEPPSTTATPEPTPTTTVESEKVNGDDLECIPVDDDGNPLKQQYVNGVTIKNIPESVKVVVDGDEVSSRPIRITSRGTHTLEIGEKIYIIEIVSAEDIFSESQKVIEIPKSITITENNGKQLFIDGEEVENFPYTVSNEGIHYIEIVKSGIEVDIKDSNGNPVLDEKGNTVKDTVKNTIFIPVNILPDVADKGIVGKEFTVDSIIKYSKGVNEIINGVGSVTISDIPTSKVVYLDGVAVEKDSVKITGDDSHYLTIYDINSKDVKTVIVYIKTMDISAEDIKNKDTVIAEDSITITDVPDDVTVIVDGKEVTERPVIISDKGKHEVTIGDSTVTVVVTDDDSKVVDSEEIKEIVDNTSEDKTPTIKDDNEVIIDLPNGVDITVDGVEVTERPIIIDNDGKHEVIIKDPETGEETKVDVVIGNVVTDEDIKDIINNTPAGETPTIKDDDKVIIEVPDGVDVIVDGDKVTERPIIIDDNGKHEVIIKDPETGEETKVDVTIDNDNKNTVGKDELKDIINNTPDGETPTITGGEEVVIEVPDGVDVIVDGEEVTERPIKITGKGEHEVTIKDPETGEETKVDVTIDRDKNDKDKDKVDKDPIYKLEDVESGKVTDENTPATGDKDNEEGNVTGTGSKTEVETPISPIVSYISGIVNNGIYMNGVKIVNNGFTVYITKDGGERKSYTSSLIELNEAGKYKIEAEKDNEIKYTFNIEIVVKEVDTSKTETADKDTIKDGGVYEGGVTIPNDGDDPIYVDGKPIIGTPVVITDPGEHEIIIDGEVITIIIPENTKPDGGVDSSKPIKPIELPSSDKIVNGEEYPGGIVIPKPENGEKVIIDGKEVTEFPYTLTGDGQHTIIIGDKDPIDIYIKDSERPDIPIIDTGVKPSPSPSPRPTGSNNDKNNNSGITNITEVPKNDISIIGSYSGVKNKKSYKKAVKLTLDNVKSGFASYKKNKKSKAKVSEFGSGTVVYRATKQGTYTVKVTYKNGESQTIKFIIDKTKPTVNVKADKKYKKGKKVTVKDGLSGIKKVTLNGKKCKTKFKLKKKGKNTICVWDKAGNKRTIKVKVK